MSEEPSENEDVQDETTGDAEAVPAAEESEAAAADEPAAPAAEVTAEPAAEEATDEAAPTAEPDAPAEEPAESDVAPVAADTTEEPAAVETTEEPAEADHGLTLGEGAPAEADEEAAIAYEPLIRGKIDKFGVAMGTGRRKTAVARVRVKPGDGQIAINGRPLDDYFSTERDRNMVQAPLSATDNVGKVDVWVRVTGGGTTGQTGAVVLGIARALQALQPAQHHKLSEAGLLTRDGRMVERKKYGLRKARRSFQFSKR